MNYYNTFKASGSSCAKFFITLSHLLVFSPPPHFSATLLNTDTPVIGSTIRWNLQILFSEKEINLVKQLNLTRIPSFKP